MNKALLAGIFMATSIVLSGCSGNTDTSTISVISREDGSGTRGAFVEIIGLSKDGIDQTTQDAIIHDGTGKVMTAVQNDPNALGYISLGSLNLTVRAVSIDGVAPSVENVEDNSYTVARPFNITINAKKKPVTSDFIEYILSPEGQEIANANGYIAIHKNAPFTSTKESGSIVIGGSTSVYPLMEKLAEAYKTINPNATINIEAIGSSAGIKGSIAGTFDIGMASRTLKDAEKAKIDHLAIALDGIAIIVNKENPIKNLTKQQVRDIYTEKITNFDAIK